MPETSFTRLSAKPFPNEPSQRLQRALAEHDVDAEALLARRDSGRAELATDPRDGVVLFTISDPEASDGIENFRELLEALIEAGAGVYAYCDVGTEYPGAVEHHPIAGEAMRLTWADGQPLLDEDTLRDTACDRAEDRRPLAQLDDAAVGAAAKGLFAAFSERP
jgi:hypothetical protein